MNTLEPSKKDADTPQLLTEIQELIQQARAQVSSFVNAGLTILYWHVGDRIRREQLKSSRAEYGQQILQTLSAKLTQDFGRGWSARNLAYMVRFVEVFNDEKKVSTLWRQLSWSHLKLLLYMKDPLQVDFYGQMCLMESWSVRTLQE